MVGEGQKGTASRELEWFADGQSSPQFLATGEKRKKKFSLFVYALASLIMLTIWSTFFSRSSSVLFYFQRKISEQYKKKDRKILNIYKTHKKKKKKKIQNTNLKDMNDVFVIALQGFIKDNLHNFGFHIFLDFFLGITSVEKK